MSFTEFFEEEPPVITIEPKVEPKADKKHHAKKAKTVSFSQYAMHKKCPHQWELAYLKKLHVYSDSIHTIFGTAVHDVLQKYIALLYDKGAPAADAYEIIDDFVERFTKLRSTAHFDKDAPNEEEFQSFVQDGKDILTWLTRPVNRMRYFPSRMYTVLGVELPLRVSVKNGLTYVGYLDIVLEHRQTKMIKILDFKTSTRNWNKWQKADPAKTDQLVLYKKFYSDQKNVPLENIEVEFFILVRTLFEGYGQQGRVATFAPAHGKGTVKKTVASFEAFLDAGFLPTGEYNTEGVFPKTDNKNICKWCEFYKKECQGAGS